MTKGIETHTATNNLADRCPIGEVTHAACTSSITGYTNNKIAQFILDGREFVGRSAAPPIGAAMLTAAAGGDATLTGIAALTTAALGGLASPAANMAKLKQRINDTYKI